MVELLLLEPSINHAIIFDSSKKVYQGRDGNPEKFTVRGLSLALPRGECFGMLGPNGAGITSFISMMIGLTEPTARTAYVQGLDIRNHMGEIYTSMGVCPQHDLPWETLTGREHLLFYGRLENLKCPALLQAAESLKSVNLFYGGVADKQSGKYRGGMKRRLSVAISLIEDPKLKARYGGSDVLTMTTPPAYEEHVENMVRYLPPGARRIYQISGMQKFELTKHEVRIADVFQAVENAKSWFTVQAWGLADTTLEDVFIKVSREAEALNVLS